MTGSTESTAQPPVTEPIPIILIDCFDDGYVEDRAWVQVTDVTDTPEKAVVALERQFPLEDREDSEAYHCEPDKQEWHRPESEAYLDAPTPWTECEEGDDGAVRFWAIAVVCPN